MIYIAFNPLQTCLQWRQQLIRSVKNQGLTVKEPEQVEVRSLGFSSPANCSPIIDPPRARAAGRLGVICRRTGCGPTLSYETLTPRRTSA
jgi:hypothetical protein